MSTLLTVRLDPGRTWAFDELPPRAIALDGAVVGPRVDTRARRYAFDHHGGCVRHATRASCEQVRDALLLGLDPTGYEVFINDLDGDSVLSLWLLLHPDRLRGAGGRRLRRLVESIGRLDAHGPGIGRAHPLHAQLQPQPGTRQTRALLDELLERIDAWWRGDPLPAPAADQQAPALALWIEGGRLRQATVRDGFRGLYRRADFGVLAGPAVGDSTAYTVAKRSEFVDFDVPAFLAACSAVEPGWGGGSTVGGAPRHADGRRSTLSLDEVGRLLLRVAL